MPGLRYWLTFAVVIYATLTSCNQPKHIVGPYRSNFAVNGYHSRQVKIKPDSTLEYRYSGHLIFDTAVAHYSLVGKRLTLNYYPITIDTSDWPELRKQGSITIVEILYKEMGKSAPYGLLLQNNKLFLVDKNDNILKKKSNSKGKDKRYFLRKIKQ